MSETAHQRLCRMFNMGAFGDKLAQEILDQYLQEYFDEFHDNDGPKDGWRLVNGGTE